MSLELELRRATDEEMDAVPPESPFKKLTTREAIDKGNWLYFGHLFDDETSNRYWADLQSIPDKPQYMVDFDWNLRHQLTSPLSILRMFQNRTYSSLDKGRREFVSANLDRVIGYLNEIIEMYRQQRIDHNRDTLGIPNSQIFGDALQLRATVKELIEMTQQSAVPGQLSFEAKADALVQFYFKIRKFYVPAYGDGTLPNRGR